MLSILDTKKGAADHMELLHKSGQLSNDVIFKAPRQIGGESSHATDPEKKVGSHFIEKKNPRPGKLKRMRMKSSRGSVAESDAGEPVGLSPSQPSPGPSRDRSGFGESISGPLQEDGCEEVVMLAASVLPVLLAYSWGFDRPWLGWLGSLYTLTFPTMMMMEQSYKTFNNK